jgi:hypothetical protein
MAASELINIQRLTGVVLIASFIAFAIGGILPIVGEKGSMGIFTLPVREHLLAVARNAVIWRWANVFMGAAAVILLAGLSMLTTLLELANERLYSRLGLIAWLVSTILWVIFSVFRGVVTVTAAQEMGASGTMGTVSASYEPLAQWGFALFYISAVIGFLALAAYGGALLQVGLVPAWAGWATLLFSLALLAQLLIMGDTLPAFHYMPPALIGVLLVIRM